MRGAIPSLPNMPIWGGAQLKKKHRDKFTFLPCCYENFMKDQYLSEDLFLPHKMSGRYIKWGYYCPHLISFHSRHVGVIDGRPLVAWCSYKVTLKSASWDESYSTHMHEPLSYWIRRRLGGVVVHSVPRLEVEVSGQFHVPVALPLGESLLHTAEEVGWIPAPVRTWWQRNHYLCRDSNPGRSLTSVQRLWRMRARSCWCYKPCFLMA
jgi:hypothetical protein